MPERTAALVLAALTASVACGSAPVTLTVDDLDRAGARFTIHNRSDRDVQDLRVLLTFRDDAGATVRVDTVAWRMASAAPGAPVAFVRAGEDVPILQAMPDGSTRVHGRILDVTFTDGGTWAGSR